jgi:hypothetical protein
VADYTARDFSAAPACHRIVMLVGDDGRYKCRVNKDRNYKMDMDRTDWDLDFEDDADESELDDAFDAAAAFETDALLNMR